MDKVRRVMVPVFRGDEKSFPFWLKRMEHHLLQEELFYTLEKLPSDEVYATPEADAAAEAQRKIKMQKRLKDDGAAINELFMAIGDEAMAHVFECKFAKEIIDRLKCIYQPKGTVAMLGLRSRLYTLKDGSYASLMELFQAHDELIRQLEGMGEIVSDTDKLNTLLVAIPSGYRHVVTALSVLRKDDLNAMALEAVKRMFLDAEVERDNAAGPNHGRVPVALVGNRQRMDPREKPKRQVTCFECGNVGHEKKSCFVLRRKKAREQRPDPNQSARTRDISAQRVALVARGGGSFMVRVPVTYSVATEGKRDPRHAWNGRRKKTSSKISESGIWRCTRCQ